MSLQAKMRRLRSPVTVPLLPWAQHAARLVGFVSRQLLTRQEEETRRGTPRRCGLQQKPSL